MADFLTNLWTSVFTPGTTPTLVAATNATFAALQLVLAALLVLTHSVHFVVLSLLCAGLWWAVNWFAAELAIAQQRQKEQEEGRRKKEELGRSSGSEPGETETETEAVGGGARRTGAVRRRVGAGGEMVGEGAEESSERESSEGESQGNTKESVEGRRVMGPGPSMGLGSRDRVGMTTPFGERSGEVSTDSEWEKVEGGR